MNSTISTVFARRNTPEAALQLMLPYGITITVIMLIGHIAAALAPQYTFAAISTAMFLVAVLFFGYMTLLNKGLQKLRFGAVIIHTLTYVLLVGGNLLHVLLAGFGGYYHTLEALMADWFGVSVTMGGIWGVGLFLHLASTIAQHGFEITNDFAPRSALTNG